MKTRKEQLQELLEYLKANPHEAERMNQCFNCRELKKCNRGDECEDENRMCKYYKPLGH